MNGSLSAKCCMVVRPQIQASPFSLPPVTSYSSGPDTYRRVEPSILPSTEESMWQRYRVSCDFFLGAKSHFEPVQVLFYEMERVVADFRDYGACRERLRARTGGRRLGLRRLRSVVRILRRHHRDP